MVIRRRITGIVILLVNVTKEKTLDEEGERRRGVIQFKGTFLRDYISLRITAMDRAY